MQHFILTQGNGGEVEQTIDNDEVLYDGGRVIEHQRNRCSSSLESKVTITVLPKGSSVGAEQPNKRSTRSTISSELSDFPTRTASVSANRAATRSSLLIPATDS